MSVKKPVHLTEEERVYLKQIIRSGTEKVRKLTRSRILMMTDAGERDVASSAYESG